MQKREYTAGRCVLVALALTVAAAGCDSEPTHPNAAEMADDIRVWFAETRNDECGQEARDMGATKCDAEQLYADPGPPLHDLWVVTGHNANVYLQEHPAEIAGFLDEFKTQLRRSLVGEDAAFPEYIAEYYRYQLVLGDEPVWPAGHGRIG